MPAVLDLETAAGEQAVAEVANTGTAVRQPCRRVLDRALGCLVVTAASRATARPHQQTAGGVQHAGIGAGLGVRAPGVGADVAVGARDWRIPLALVGRDRVHHPADGVRPVEERGRPAHDFNSFEAVRVDRDAVVPRLAREVAGADPVLHQ